MDSADVTYTYTSVRAFFLKLAKEKLGLYFTVEEDKVFLLHRIQAMTRRGI